LFAIILLWLRFNVCRVLKFSTLVDLVSNVIPSQVENPKNRSHLESRLDGFF